MAVLCCEVEDMPDTVNAVYDSLHAGETSDGMGKKATAPTKPVRLHTDVAELLEQLAPIFGQTVPDFASSLLRPVLQEHLPKAAKRLMDKQRTKGAKPSDSN